jgi:hypothetical protein
MSDIQLLSHSNIDRKKWDATIIQANNSRIYAYSWYLDIVSPNWMGLIYGDYEFIMPIGQSKKYGLRYIYQPTYAQQHGIFPNPKKEITSLFIQKTQKLAPLIIIALNSDNEAITNKFEQIKKPNYLLPLDKSYKEIRANFSQSHKKYINKANRNIVITTNVEIDQYIDLKKRSSEGFLTQKNLLLLKEILKESTQRGICSIIGALDHNNHLCSAGVFLNSESRILHINATSDDIGKEHRAIYAIIDHIIKQNAEKNVTIDFEGSTIKGIAQLFERFGAKPEYYTIIKRNSIPLLKYFMK